MTKNIFYSYISTKKQKVVIYNVIFKFNNIIITDKINLIIEIKMKNCYKNEKKNVFYLYLANNFYN